MTHPHPHTLSLSEAERANVMLALTERIAVLHAQLRPLDKDDPRRRRLQWEVDSVERVLQRLDP